MLFVSIRFVKAIDVLFFISHLKVGFVIKITLVQVVLTAGYKNTIEDIWRMSEIDVE